MLPRPCRGRARLKLGSATSRAGILVTEPITVITLTRGRRHLLERAIASVTAQDHRGHIEHLVVVDDDPETLVLLESRTSHARRRLVPHFVARPWEEKAADADDRAWQYPRCARLLNYGVRRARTPWVAFLDDDNTYEPEHLRLLAACSGVTGAPAVHAARQVFWPDGRPFLDACFPSAVEDGERIYEILCRRGVLEPGTNILMDRVDARQENFVNSTIMGDDAPVFLVDQNVWLIKRELLLRHPIPEKFSAADIAANTCPDDKMLETLVRNGVEIVGNGQPTVRYFLGGISNPQNGLAAS